MRKIKWLSWVGTKCVYPKTRVAWVFGILKSSTLLYWQNMGDVYKLVQILVHKVLKTRYFPNADFLSAWGTIHLYLEKHYVCTISGSTRYSLAGGQWPVHQRMQWQMVEPTINFLSYLQTCYGTSRCKALFVHWPIHSSLENRYGSTIFCSTVCRGYIKHTFEF